MLERQHDVVQDIKRVDAQIEAIAREYDELLERRYFLYSEYRRLEMKLMMMEIGDERRPRDYAYEALAEVTGCDMNVDRGRLNAALREIREREPDIESYPLADLIYERAKLYVEMWPEGGLTPTALSKHWDALPGLVKQKTKPVVTNAPMRPSECGTCGGDRMVPFRERPSKNPRSPYEEVVPCPDCNSGASVGYWRADGSRFNLPDPAVVRRRLT